MSRRIRYRNDRIDYHKRNREYIERIIEAREIMKDIDLMWQIRKSKKDVREGRVIDSDELFREIFGDDACRD